MVTMLNSWLTGSSTSSLLTTLQVGVATGHVTANALF